MKLNELFKTAVLPAIFILALSSLQAQNTIGIPNIINYSKQVYGAGSQTWNIAQDKNGIMYFANNEGLLSFDGSYWRTYSLPNKTIVRSVAIGADNRIYVGGQKEIGYFFPSANGDLAYTALNNLLPEKDNDFADVWNICFFNGHVFFRSNKKILDYYNNRFAVYNSANWGFMSSVAGQLIAYESDKQQLLKFSNGQWLPAIRFGGLPKDNIYLRTALPIGKDSILLVSLVHGLFILHHDSLSVFATNDKSIAAQNISAACLLTPDRIALATNLSGCIIINKQGSTIQRFTKQEGIQNNNARIAYLDSDKNLWLGLDNGIDLITCNNAIKNIFPDKEARNAGYVSLIFNGQLYLGLSTGVFKIKLDDQKDLSYTNGSFELVQQSEGQVWSLDSLNNKLLMGHNKGGFLIENNKAIPIETKTGFWAFHRLNMMQPSASFFAGTYSGLSFYNNKDGLISNAGIDAAFESSRYIAISDNTIWIAHPYKGVYSVRFDGAKPVVSIYKDKLGILSANHNRIFKLKDKVVLISDKGNFEFDKTKADFIPATWLDKLVGGLPISYIREDAKGNIWFCSNRKVAVIDQSFKEPKTIFIPEIDNRIMAGGFENINVIDSDNVLIAAEKGFFHINYALYKRNKQAVNVLIRKVQLPLKTEGLLYGGYDSIGFVPSIAYRYNALHFECSSTLYGQEQNTEYSYYLEGFDKGWSDWGRKREKDYTNLPAGNYVFKVKCRNNFDSESAVAGFAFKILPPWYQTWWAYLLYAVIFFGLLYLFYKRQQRKYRRVQQQKLAEQQRKYDEEQKQLQLQHQLEIQENEKQIVELRNEKLQSEVEHKNSELASSAMNLVRKKEMLSKLKDDLIHYKETKESEKAAKEFQKIIKLLNSELDQEGEWDQFVEHFDSVHTNYLKKLKEGYPSLSVSDLKLAAYLRLNLSSKEIAQLLNISLRGVETSRYRLRKKLGIENEVNLSDFLISITK